MKHKKELLSDYEAQVKLCKYFFDTYCVKRKIFRETFGKFSIEKFFGTSISQQAFIEAILMTDTKLVNDTFQLVIDKRYRNEILFDGYIPANVRWAQFENFLETNLD